MYPHLELLTSKSIKLNSFERANISKAFAVFVFLNLIQNFNFTKFFSFGISL